MMSIVGGLLPWNMITGITHGLVSIWGAMPQHLMVHTLDLQLSAAVHLQELALQHAFARFVPMKWKLLQLAILPIPFILFSRILAHKTLR